MNRFEHDRPVATAQDWHEGNIYKGDHTQGEIELAEIATTPSFENPFSRVFEDRVVFPNGNLGTYIRIDSGAKDGTPRPDGNIVVAFDQETGQVLLLKQFRHTTRRVEFGLPRGFGHHDLSSTESAIQQMLEETGCTVVQMEHRGNCQPDNGKLIDYPNVWVVRVVFTPEVRDQQEGIKGIMLVPFDRLFEACSTGEIECCLTATALVRAWPSVKSVVK